MNLATERSYSGEYLSNLLGGLREVDKENDILIEDLCLDSRKVSTGSLFFAIPGEVEDGRRHIQQAIQAGARAVVYESEGWSMERQDDSRLIGVRDLRRQIGTVADVFYGKPSSKMHVVGITGTNGKSTCASLTAQAFEALGKKCGIVGTLGSGFPAELSESSLTTPDPVSLHQNLASLLEAGAEYLCLEVSSHSLDQSRTKGVRFSTVVFTNLSQDHMDYHRSQEHYRASKAKLFVESTASSAILNIDDEFGRSMLGKTSCTREFTYGSAPADIQLQDCISTRRGLVLKIAVQGRSIEVQSELLGGFNGINLTTVAAVLHAHEFELADIERALHAVKPVAGRMERISGSSAQPEVFVDYAHTPDGLKSALQSLREITEGNLVCVFGCGGNRDDEKRPIMGAISEKHADHVIVTDDNPRGESPQAITRRILEGMRSKPKVIHDRREAIRSAVKGCGRNDTILIAGKGHETTQTYGSKVIPFSDREAVTDALRSLG